MTQKLIFFGFVCLAMSVPLAAQQTIVSPSRSIDWTRAGVRDGIPNRTTVCTSVPAGASAATINSALAGCPAGQVVQLAAGTYNLNAGITFNGRSNVTLRGAGPDRTFLLFTGYTSCFGQGANVCVGGVDLGYYAGQPLHIAEWTGGYAKGSTTITLSHTSGLSAGMPIVVDQLNDTSDPGQDVIVCSVSGVCSDEWGGGGGRTNREQAQYALVTAINGLNVTISAPLHMPNWRSAMNPQAFWGNPNSYSRGNGVEDLSMDHAGTGSGPKTGIDLKFTYDSWVKNVRSLYANRNHIWLFQSFRSTIRDSYFYGTQNAASQSYGIEEFMASDNLIENNILHHIAAPLQTNGGSGSVFAYNYTFDNFFSPSPAWQQASSYLHSAGTAMILHEGNEGTGLTGDIVHGTHNFVTAFRNNWHGQEPGKTSQTVPILLYSFNRYMNIVGNVIGRSGYHTGYECDVSCGNYQTVIYRLGTGSNKAPNDTHVKTTLMRWGNYDTVTASSRFVPAEVPTGLAKYANATPSTSLPASFYLQARPSWWGTMPWPAIGPDVTGGNGEGGRAHSIPARVCYDRTPKTGAILNFNAFNCYGTSGTTSSPPGAPTNVRVIR